jgi:hypothetical protein
MTRARPGLKHGGLSGSFALRQPPESSASLISISYREKNICNDLMPHFTEERIQCPYKD